MRQRGLTRLVQISDEEYSFRLKTPWSDGTTHLAMELIEKLAALVPPPRQNLVRYHEVLAPNAKLRSSVVPKKPDETERKKTRGKSRNRRLWAALPAPTIAQARPPPQEELEYDYEVSP